jgi:hypothetical protein
MRQGSTPPETKTSQRDMGRLSFFLIVVVLGAVVAGGIFLTTWEIPAPTHKVEKVIPNDRFAE